MEDTAGPPDVPGNLPTTEPPAIDNQENRQPSQIEEKEIDQTVVLHGVPSFISPKHLQDFFKLYCGTILFISFDRENKQVLLHFGSDTAARSALTLRKTYIVDNTPIRIDSYLPDSNRKLTKALAEYLETKRREDDCVKPNASIPALIVEEKEKEIKEEKQRESTATISSDKEAKGKEKEGEDTQIEVPPYLAPWDKKAGSPFTARHEKHAEMIQKLKEEMSGALPYGLGQTEAQVIKIVKKKRSTASSPSPVTRLEFEKARVSYQKKGILYNFRDISFFPSSNSTSNHVLPTQDGFLLKRGVMYRSACWSRISDATPEDVRAVFEFLQASCQICTLIDLRSKSEKKEDQLDKVVEELYPTVPISSQLYHYVNNQGASALCKRFSVDLVTRNMKFKGLVWSAPTSVYLKILSSALGRRRSKKAAEQSQQQQQKPTTPTTPTHTLKPSQPTTTTPSPLALRNSHDEVQLSMTTNRRQQNIPRASVSHEEVSELLAKQVIQSPSASQEEEDEEVEEEMVIDPDLENLMDSFIDEPSIEAESASQMFVQRVFNPLGLLGFTKLLVIHAPIELGKVLRLCIDRRNHPLMFHCTSGKDRTGLIAALILTICGVPRDLVVDTYHLSERYLHSVSEEIVKENRTKGLDENFDGTPKFVMRGALQFIEEKFGSIPKYLNDVCKFSYVEQDFLRKIMVSNEQATSLTDDVIS